MRSRIPLLIVIIALLILGLIVFFGVRSRLRQITADLPNLLEDELEIRLEREVRIRSTRVTSPTTAVITDLEIADGRTFRRGTLFFSPRSVIRFSAVDILLGRTTVARSITSVTLTNPRIRLTRNRQGVWNIEDLLRRPPVPPAQRFRGLVSIRGGRLLVVDYAAQLPRLPARNALHDVSGRLGFEPAQYFRVNLTGRGAGGRVRQVSAIGRWGVGAPRTDLRLSVRNADASYWLDYFSNIRPWGIRRGRFDARATLSQPRGAGIVARGSASLRDSAITSPYLTIPVRPFAANIRFIGANISLAGRGYLRRSPVLISGQVLGLAPARLDLRMISERMDPATLQAAVRPLPAIPQTRWPAPASIAATVTGLSTGPVVSGVAQVPRAVVYGTPATAIAARGFYRAGVIRVTSLTAGAAGGSVTASAAIDLRLARIRASGTALGVNLAAILPGRFPVAGAADARFSFEYLRGLRSARLAAEVTRGRIARLSFARGRIDVVSTAPRTARITASVVDGTTPGAAIQAANAILALRGRRILVQQLTVDAYRGSVTARGEATLDGGLNLRLIADRIDLRALLVPLGYRQLTGTANFVGTLTGTVDSPRLEGRLSARDGQIRQVRYDLLFGRLIATEQQLVLENAVIQRERAEIVTAGRIVVARRAPPRVELQVRARQVDLAQVFSLLGIPAPARGMATADLQVRGRYPELQVSGTIRATDAGISGVSFDEAVVQLQVSEGRTVITQLFARREEMRVAGRGFIGPGGQLQVDLLGENLNLRLLNDIVRPYVVLNGPMDFSGELRGTLSRPTIRGIVASSSPSINRQQFDSLSAGILWDGIRLTLADGVILGQGTAYRIALLRFNPSADFLELRTSITSGSIARIVGMFQNSPILGLPRGQTLRRLLATVPTPFTGAVNASLNLSGPIGNLSGGAAIEATGVQMGSTVVTRAEAELVAQRSTFLLSRLAVASPGVRLAASARFVQAQPVLAAASIEDTRLPPLIELIRNAPFLPFYDFGRRLVSAAEGIPQPVTGTVSASLSIDDIQAGGTGTLSITAQGISVAESVVGDVDADIRLADGAFFIDRILLTPPQGRALVQGTINPEGLISLTGQGTGIPLEIARPWANVSGLSGTLDFQLRAAGTISSPMLESSFTLQDFRTDRISIDSISAERLTIAGNRIATERIEVAYLGSRLVASGSLPFVWEPPFVPRDQPILVRAELEDQDLSIAESLAIVQEARGPLSARMEITGTIDDPVFDGRISLQDGFLNLRGFENDFTDITLDAVFQDSTLAIQTLTGVSSLGGNFSANGAVTLADADAGLLTIFVTLDSLRLDIDNLTGTVRERLLFTATGQLVATETIRSPLVQGQVVVRDAHLTVPAETLPTTVQIPQLPVNPRLAITVNLTRDVVVERGGLRAEILGPVTLGGTFRSPLIAGTIQVASGGLRYVGRTLEILPGGTASFLFQPPQPAVISVDITARTRVTALSPITGRVTRFTVIMDIAGPIGDLEIDARSSPPGLTELEALTYVFGGAPAQAIIRGVPLEQVIQQQLGQVLVGIAVPGLFQPFEIEGVVFTLEPGFDVPLQVSASTFLTGRVTLSYSRSIIGRIPVDNFSLSYIFAPQLAFTVMFEGQNAAPRETTYLVEYFTRF